MLRIRGADDRTAIAVIGPDRRENRAFLSFSKTFRELGLPVPEVYGADEAEGIYLLEDLGDTTLFDVTHEVRARANGAFSEAILPVYRRVLDHLPRFQVEGGRAVDYSVAYPRAALDEVSIHWDLSYFKYHFLKLAHVPFHEARLEEDFQRLTTWLGQAEAQHFVYRDFQSRNIMLRQDDPWFIDYQGGLRGPLQYDVAKLLYEGKARLPEAVRAELLDHYLDALAEHVPVDRERFLAHYRGFVFLRIMQGMGAYGYLGLYGRKPQFLARIPHAINDIETLLGSGFMPLELPELKAAFAAIVSDESLRLAPPPPQPGLTVRVGSFSYKRGVPEDVGGHGGGFAFDCRALPNPGRQAEYAGRSGLEAEVIAYLDAEAACEPYFRHVLELVATQVQAYLERGFDSLQVQFGCTGGQHRSVYMAERLGAALSARFPAVHTQVTHAEAVHWPAKAMRPGASRSTRAGA